MKLADYPASNNHHAFSCLAGRLTSLSRRFGIRQAQQQTGKSKEPDIIEGSALLRAYVGVKHVVVGAHEHTRA